MSDADIGAGQRGLTTIERELAGTSFGIIVVTRQNQDAPWLNFEAGALSKVVQQDLETRVAPLLVDISNPSQITGPISQFQAKLFSMTGLLELVQGIAAVAGADAAQVEKRFNAFWPDLETTVSRAVELDEIVGESISRPVPEMVEEVLNIVRAMRSEQQPPALLSLAAARKSERQLVRVEPGYVAEILQGQGADVAMVRTANPTDEVDFIVGLGAPLDDANLAVMSARLRALAGVEVRFVDDYTAATERVGDQPS
jgi:hypothetical protein